jgi:hypothetical protein
MAFNDDYVDVAERLRLFKAAYPTGCLRPANPEQPFTVQEIGGREFIVYVAAAYRTPDDPMPAIAVAAEPAVGKTNFTRDSEVMNAETSAWGRAILAALAADSKKIASLDEVRNRRAEQDRPPLEDVSRPKAPPRVKAGSAARSVTKDQADHPSMQPAPSGKISAPQMKLIQKLMGETSSDVSFVSSVVGRDIEPVGLVDLSSREASGVIKALIERKDSQ